MKIKNLLAGTAIVMSATTNAAILNYDLVYDGSVFNFNGGSWNGQAFNVEDTINVTLSADTGDHWEWLSGSNLWTGNFLDTPGCNQFGTSTWSFDNNGANVAGGTSTQNQACVHFGPQNPGAITASVGTIWDTYNLSYEFISGDNTTLYTELNGSDYLSGERGLIWDWTFNNGTNFVYVDANESVPAPATLALFGLGLAGLGWSRRKKA